MSLSFAVIFSSASSGILFPPSAEKRLFLLKNCNLCTFSTEVRSKKLSFLINRFFRKIHLFVNSISTKNRLFQKIVFFGKSTFSANRIFEKLTLFVFICIFYSIFGMITYLDVSKRFSFHCALPDNLLKFQIVNFD